MKKPAPNRLGMYSDVKQVLDACLETNGGTYTLSTYGEAVHWRQRAYRFRKLFAETLKSHELSPYDVLTLPRIVEDTSVVVINLQQAKGTFTPNREAAIPEIPETDDLLGDAMALAERLNKGEAP